MSNNYRTVLPKLLVVGLTLLASTAASAAEQAAPVQPAGLTQPAKPLDLRAPDITKLYTPAQINRMLASTIRSDIEEVEVEGKRERIEPRTPTAWPGILAPVWAVLNPTQAWRIFAPLPPDQADAVPSARFDPTVGYLEPAAQSVCDTCLPRR